MKLLAPLGKLDEAELLIECGADELYCGVVPEGWKGHFGDVVWLNRRGPASGNLRSLAELRSLSRLAESAGVPVFVVLNAARYGAAVEARIVDLAYAFLDAGCSGLIVADPGIISDLLEKDAAMPVHVSSVASVLSSWGVRFFHSLGARRVILPRGVTLAEIARIHREAPEARLEAFLLNDACAFEEGFCFTTHHPSVGAYCTSLARASATVEAAGDPLSPTRQDAIAANLAEYHRWINGRNPCGILAAGGRPVPVPCALCAIPALARAGVVSVKIVGREAGRARKTISTCLARTVLDRFHAGVSDRDLAEFARGARGDAGGCATGGDCYYPLPPELQGRGASDGRSPSAESDG